MLATIGLFYGFAMEPVQAPVIVYRECEPFPDQMTIRAFITGDEAVPDTITLSRSYTAGKRYNASNIVCILPILMVYPFLQKYLSRV